MTEQIQEIAEKPAKRKYTRKAKTKAKAKREEKPFVAPSEFAGLTAVECCTACYESGICVISGSVCAHPNKGGLQATLMRDGKVMAKFQRAKKALAHQKLDLTGG